MSMHIPSICIEDGGQPKLSVLTSHIVWVPLLSITTYAGPVDSVASEESSLTQIVPHSSTITGCTNTYGFMKVLRIQTQVLKLVWQALYQLSHLLSPFFFCFLRVFFLWSLGWTWDHPASVSQVPGFQIFPCISPSVLSPGIPTEIWVNGA